MYRLTDPARNSISVFPSLLRKNPAVDVATLKSYESVLRSDLGFSQLFNLDQRLDGGPQQK